MDDRPGYGVDEDVVVNAAGDGTDLIHGVEAGLHRLAWLLTLLCRRLLALGYCLPLLWVLLRGCLRRRQFLRRLEGRGPALMILGTHLRAALSRSQSFIHIRTAFFVAVRAFSRSSFAAAIFPMFFASVSMLHAVHVKEGDFFKVQLTFVFADGLGSCGTGLFFIDETDAFLLCLGLGQIGHSGDLLFMAGHMALVEIVAAAGTGDDGDDDKSGCDFCIAGGEHLIFDGNECILPFFLGHDEFLLSVLASF